VSENYSSFEDRVRDSITALRLVMPDVLVRERERAHTKWYEYRFMSPLEATTLFVNLYRKGFQRYIRTNRDIHDADAAQGLSSRLFGGPSASLTEVWNARQRADELGLPYNLLIEFGFHFAGRRTRKRAPRPGQLFDSGAAGVAWPIEFEKWIRDPLHYEVQRLDMPQYRHENYRSFPAQREFHDYILESIVERVSAWGPKLAHHCISRCHLPIKQAMRVVPKGARNSVVRYLRDELELVSKHSSETLRLPDIALAPACFGLPNAADETSTECMACPLAERCSVAGNAAMKHMLERYGSVSPIHQSRKKNKNEKTNLRVRRHRAKKNNQPSEAYSLPEPIPM
jgi:hypothetical protein